MAFDGKLGIALSGGGFRASFFHIGVLAALADRDLLRHVEVISTVSGGSIVGALYTIKAKQLLERKEDSEITARDFQELVADLTTQFLETVQRNLRLQAFSDPIKNARMVRADYSRSDRMGEIFDRSLYRPAFGPNRREPVRMEELLITPKSSSAQVFSPDRENRGRHAKVPVLVINATSLNTGRNWRFEAVRMGEPEQRGRFAADIDMRLRLEPLPSYDAIGSHRRHMLLGHAVAASAAVPAIFYPLAISQLYEGVRVELIDGGIHDNQGVGALLDRRCDHLVVSDGSSQMVGDHFPGTSITSVLLRTNEILMSRVREEQLLRAHQSHGKRLCLAHLQQGIPAEYIPYRTADGRVVSVEHEDRTNLPSSRIHPDVRQALAHVRTDLDAFNDVESFALMRVGYLNAAQQLRSFVRSNRQESLGVYPWNFTAIDTLLREPTSTFLKVLETASSNAFKVFSLYRALSVGTASALVGGFSLWVWSERATLVAPIIPIDRIPSRLTVLGWLLGGIVTLLPSLRRSFRQLHWAQNVWASMRVPVRFLGRAVFRAMPWVMAALPVWIYLRLLNPLYLKAGKLERCLRGRRKGERVTKGYGARYSDARSESTPVRPWR